jgi:adenosine deaminase CECR1
VRWLAAILLSGLCFAQTPFDAQWKRLTHSLPKPDLYRLLLDLPKGGDLHNHHEYSVPMTFWLERGSQHGFLTRVRPGCGETLQWTALHPDSVRKLPPCEQSDFVPMRSLTAHQKRAWLSALTLDDSETGKPCSKDEFFERAIPRLGDLERDPQLMADALVAAQQQLRAENALYLETQADPRGFPGLTEDQGADIFRRRLAQPDSAATGVAVRMQVSTLRFGDRAEADLRDGFAFVTRNRDLWTAVNLVGREDNPAGAPARFASLFTELRAQYPRVNLSLHAGESATADSHVAETIALGATRIGHGINSRLDPQAMDLLRSGRYLIEICLMSNRALGYVPDLKRHPLPLYLREGIPVSLNTDDRGTLQSTLTDEYFAAVSLFDLSWPEVVRIGRWSLEFSFAEPELKTALLARYDERIRAFEQKYSAPDWKRKLAQVRLNPRRKLPTF